MIKNVDMIIISGPSGAGKGTLIKRLLEDFNCFDLAISATTRAPREGEVHGKDYYFLDKDAFEKEIEADAFVEWCNVHHNYYGTLKSEITKNPNTLTLLEIDTQGTEKVRETDYNAFTVFIAPPDIPTLKQRLIERNTESIEVIERRLKRAEEELKETSVYDSVIVNNNLEIAFQELVKVLKLG